MRFNRLLKSTLLIFAFLFLSPAAASAQTFSGEHADSYKVDIRVHSDTSFNVEETIEYDFGSTPKHGIFRAIPTVFPYNDEYERVIKVENFQASDGKGNAYKVKKVGTPQGPNFRIGDEDETLTGKHTYLLTYVVRGAFNEFRDHQELYWNAAGNGSTIQINDASARVSGEAPISQVNCFAGDEYSRAPCADASHSDTTAQFSSPVLYPYQSLTIVVGYPLGAYKVPPPILREKFSLDRAFSRTPATVGSALIIAIGAIAFFVMLWWRNGRDKQFAGTATDAAMASSGSEVSSPIGGTETPVQFEPPDGMRPAELAALLHEEVRSRDLTATLVDLAARGYIEIREDEPSGKIFKHAEWTFILKREWDDLLPYERILMKGIFGTSHAIGDEVSVADLKGKFADDIASATDSVYSQLVKDKLYKRSPEKTRTMWRVVGWLILTLTVALVALTAWKSHAALAVVSLPLVGLLLLLGAHYMPARTGKGTAAYRRGQGFRKLFTDQEAQRATFAENKNIFYEYLPYAVAFGVANKWARTFSKLATEQGWEVSGLYPHWYMPLSNSSIEDFTDSVDHFAVATTGTLGYSPASSGGSGFGGGGFSGGGFGGGSVGSW